MFRLDAHVHLGRIYYSKKSKTKDVEFSYESVLDYIKRETLTHLLGIYIEEDREVVERVKRDSKIKIYPFLWVSKGDEKYDKDFNYGVKLHPIRNHDREPLDLQGRIVVNYLENLPDNTCVMIHTQDLQFNPNTSFYSVTLLAQQFPRLKFILAHGGSVGIKSRLPSVGVMDKDPKFARQILGHFCTDSALVYGALMSSFLFKNIMVELSCITPNLILKPMILGMNPMLLENVCLGSDQPFFGKDIGIKAEEQNFKRFFGYTDDDIEDLHKRAVKYITEDKFDEKSYENCEFNMQWLSQVVSKQRRWKYVPRARASKRASRDDSRSTYESNNIED